MKRFCIIILLFVSFTAFSQEKIISYKDAKIVTVLKDLEQIFKVKFSYPSDLISNEKISLQGQSLDDVLFEISYLTNIQFNKLDGKYIYLTKIKTEKFNKIVINSYLTTGITKNKNATYAINLKKLGLLAGLTETDILESIQQLPGVISIDETATQLNVRGGNADQNQVVWDGITIYHGGHLFGMISVFNPNIAKNVTFYNKGTNAKYGDRVSSVIAISTSKTIAKKPHVELGLNGLSSDVCLELPINDKLSIQTSFRRSYEDALETITFKKYEEKAFQNTKILEEKFYYKDYNAKINFIPNKKNQFYMSLIHIDNDFFNTHQEDNIFHSDVLDTENDGFSGEWHHQWRPSISLNSNLSYSKYTLFYNNKLTQDDLLISDFYKTNTIKDFVFLTILNIKFKKNAVDLGYQRLSKNVGFLFKENKNMTPIIDQDQTITNTHSIITNFYRDSKKLSIYSGLRLNYYSTLNQYKIEPRFVITQSLSNAIKLQLTGEIKNQIISQIEETVLSSLSLENNIWRLADGETYPIINSRQISSSLLFTKNKWSADIDVYYKKTKGLTTLSLGFLNPLDNDFHLGVQKVKGMDFYLKRNFNALKTGISYSFIDAQNKYDTLNNNKYFRSNNDIKHAITTSVGYELKRFNVALNWKYRTGRPLTDLDYDSNENPYFDGINTEQLPDYHRLDISSTYKFTWSKVNNIKGKIGISIRNVYNQKNTLTTNFSGENNTINVKQYYSIGITPNFMCRLYW